MNNISLSMFKTAFIAVLFLIYLLLGLGIFKDYGVHRDEFTNQKVGLRWDAYVESVIQNKKIQSDPFAKPTARIDVVHGPFFEIVLASLSRVFLGHQADIRGIIFFRHLAVFLLFFASSICFFFICLHLFQRRLYALMGVAMFVLHPRIFAHSFYNTVDIACLAFFVFSFGSMILFIKRRNPGTLVMHGLACALLYSTRSIGLIIPVFTMILLLIGFFSENRRGSRKMIPGLIFDLVSLCIVFCSLSFLFCPLLWHEPFKYFCDSLSGNIFFHDYGKYSPYYNFYWIGITTPLAYLGFFLVGMVTLLSVKVSFKLLSDTKWLVLLFALMLVLIPVLGCVINKVNLYNDWRHHYFIYPFLVLVAVHGVRELIECFDKEKSKISTVGCVFVKGALLISLVTTLFIMILLHPYQYVYANILSRGYTSSLTMEDQWTLSAYDGYKYIAKNDLESRITVSSDDHGQNCALLPALQRKRLCLLKAPLNSGVKPEYVIRVWGNSQFDLIRLSGYSKVYSISKFGKEIVRVYKRI